MKNFINSLRLSISGILNLRADLDDLKILSANILIEKIKEKGLVENIQDVEFKVFSQFGDDGIIQYLIHNIDIPVQKFVEFGVGNYRESNTRFLLIHDNWEGIVFDCDKKSMKTLKSETLYWQHNIQAVHAFIDKDNINSLLASNGFSGDIGILHIDIDGNDYWVWEAIDGIDPTIVIVEYNSIFGCKYALSIPYQEDFSRKSAHYSNLYFGASLKAYYQLARKKGYEFVGSNSAGNNAYFIKKEKMNGIKPVSLEEGYVESKFRESRDEKGRLNFISGRDRIKIIQNMEIVELEKNERIKIHEIMDRLY
jgi:hypothetical protein